MATSPVRVIDPGLAVERIVLTLAQARAAGDPTRMPATFREADPQAVRQWPGWVAGAGVLRSRGLWWLWCEPRKGARRAMGQVVMDVPAGRYMIDILDTHTRAWFSRESAAAAPLVAGLPSTGHPLLVRIRRFSGAE